MARNYTKLKATYKIKGKVVFKFFSALTRDDYLDVSVKVCYLGNWHSNNSKVFCRKVGLIQIQ